MSTLETQAPEPAARRPGSVPIAGALALLVAFSFGAPLIGISQESLLVACVDDTYYYLAIARSVAAGRGLTFDGIHPTTGFHPAWLGTLVPVFWLVPGEFAAVAAALWLQVGLIALAVALVYRALEGPLGHWPAVAGALTVVATPIGGAALRVFRAGALGALPPAGIALVGLAAAAVVAVAVLERRRLATALGRSGAALLLLGLPLLALAERWAVPQMFPWYLVPWLLATALFAAHLLDRRPRLAPLFAAGAIAGCLLRPWYERRMLANPERRVHHYRLAAARWLNDNTGPETRVGSWNAGLIGYFTRRPVVNLDGLVNDREFAFGFAARRHLGDYLERERIDWLADYGCGPISPAHYLAMNASADLGERFEVAATFLSPDTPNRCPGIVVWRRRTPAGGAS